MVDYKLVWDCSSLSRDEVLVFVENGHDVSRTRFKKNDKTVSDNCLLPRLMLGNIYDI